MPIAPRCIGRLVVLVALLDTAPLQAQTPVAAGVTAGIDMALHLVAREAGPEIAQAVQLGIEYDPDPPFDSGSPEKAPAEIVALVTAVASAGDPLLGAGD